MFHTWAWIAWLVAAAMPAFSVRNPLYLVLVLGAAWIVYAALGRTSPIGSSWGAFVRIGVFFLALAIPFTAFANHMGRIVLFHLPANWPIVGGPITLESTIAGAVNGLALLTILMTFAAFNAGVDHYQLLRAIPSFLFQAGVVLSIAITFVPQMVLSAREIREAQRIRGHHFRGLRDLLPLILPLLANSLERAIQLAETMEARGFGSAILPISQQRAMLTQLGMLAALLGLLAGMCIVAYWPERRTWGWILAGLAAGGMLIVFWLQAKRVQRTRYRRSKWTGRDTAVVLASAVVVTTIVISRLIDPEMLTYTPYPPYPLLPLFQPLVGAVLLLLALPALLALRATQQIARGTEWAP